RTTDKSSAGNAVRISRPFHGLSLVIALIPTDKSVGYFQSSASPTFWETPSLRRKTFFESGSLL
ncbi:MAG TPA: hypothetical protein VHQ64_12140, partial [Pyrinomonadaceae bacterium]|nr:hypothetical protein [Pyrinomonadaceae bacterium]